VKNFILGFLLLFLFFQIGEAADQQVPIDLSVSENLLTTARLPQQQPVPAYHYPASVEIFTADQIQKSHARTVAEFLNQNSSFELYDLSNRGSGLAGQINARGFNGEKSATLVLLNGVRLNDPNNGTVLWTAIPMSSIERIEVIKGSQVVYGEGALAGVINIITKKEKNQLNAFLGTNSHIEGGLIGNVNLNEVMLQTQLEHVKGNGYRQNSNYDYGNAVLSSQWQGWNFSYARHFGNYANPNYLNYNNYQNNPQKSNNASSQYYLEVSDRTQITYEAILFDNWQWRNQISAVNRIQNSDIGFGLYEGNMNTMGGVTQVMVPLSSSQTLQTGIDYYEDQVFAGSLSALPKSLVKRNTRGLFFDALTQFNEFIDLDLAARFDQTDINYQNVTDTTYAKVSGKTSLTGSSPKIAINLHPVHQNKTYFSLSRTYKAPASEDFATFIAPYVTNTQIQPQSAETFEMGMIQDWRDGQASFVYYNTQVTNEIFYNNVSFQNDNVDTTHTGYEASIKQNFWDHFEFRLGYQSQDAFFRGSIYNNIYQAGKKIPGVSAQQFQYALSYSPDTEITITYLGRSVSDFFIANDIQNVQGKQNGYGVADLKFSKQMSDIRFLFQMRNIWDARYTTYVGWFGGANQYYPAEGRSIMAGIEYLF